MLTRDLDTVAQVDRRSRANVFCNKATSTFHSFA
jgi:hypothetical protein